MTLAIKSLDLFQLIHDYPYIEEMYSMARVRILKSGMISMILFLQLCVIGKAVRVLRRQYLLVLHLDMN